MSSLGRLLAWFVFLTGLGCFGWAVFVITPEQPICTLRGSERFYHLSDDGSFMVTWSFDSDEVDSASVHFWDCRKGWLLGSFAVNSSFIMLGNDRDFAWNHEAGNLQVVDWRSGGAWSPALKTKLVGWESSPDGHWLAVHDEHASYMIDIHERRIAWRLEARPLQFARDNRHVICRTNDSIVVLDVNTGAERLKLADHKRRTEEDLLRTFELPVNTDPTGTSLFRMTDSGAQPFVGVGMAGELNIPDAMCATDNSTGFEVWDLATCRLCWRYLGEQQNGRCVLLSPDSSVLATWVLASSDPVLEVFVSATGERLASMRGKEFSGLQFSLDSKRLLFHGGGRLTCAAVSGDAAWTDACEEFSSEYARILDNQTVLVRRVDTNYLEARDARSGDRKNVVWPGQVVHFNLTADRSIAVIQELRREHLFWEWLARLIPERPSHWLILAQPASGQPIFRLPYSMDRTYFVLSKNAVTLVTVEQPAGEETRTIRVWDVYSRRRHTMAVAASLILGAILVGARTLWRRRREKRAAVAAS